MTNATAETGANKRGLRYHPELDGIRAIAVLLVMLFHTAAYHSGYGFRGGFLGVDIFFVLSGYLITTLLLRELGARGGVSFKKFYVRRGLRLLPALMLVLLFGAFVAKFTGFLPYGRPYWKSALLALFYVGNWPRFIGPTGVLSHTWSLAIEEQYYLVWPVVLVAGLRLVRSKSAMASVLGIGAVLVALSRFAVWSSGQYLAAAFSTITRSDGIILGSALALVLAAPPGKLVALLRRREPAFVGFAAVLAAYLVVKWTDGVMYKGGFLVLNVCIAFVVGFIVLNPSSAATRALSLQPLPAIGRISYGLYLFHVPVYHLVHDRSHWNGWASVVFSMALTFAIATTSYLVVEQRALRLKRRFGSVSQLPVAAASPAPDPETQPAT